MGKLLIMFIKRVKFSCVIFVLRFFLPTKMDDDGMVDHIVYIHFILAHQFIVIVKSGIEIVNDFINILNVFGIQSVNHILFWKDQFLFIYLNIIVYLLLFDCFSLLWT